MLLTSEIDLDGHIAIAEPEPLGETVTRLLVEWDGDLASLIDPETGDVVEVIQPSVAA